MEETNYSLKALRYTGAESDGWRDITSSVVVRGTGASDPTWAQIGATGPFRGYKFAVGDECWMAFHIPHDIVPNTDIYFHTHWIPDGTDTNSVKWQFTFAYARGFDQDAFDMDAGTVVTSEQAGPGVAYQHMVTESTATTVANLDEPDGMIYCHIERVTNGGTDNTDDIFLLTADIHYESTSHATLGKAPNFYTGRIT
jgi:hypothetical protein